MFSCQHSSTRLVRSPFACKKRSLLSPCEAQFPAPHTWLGSCATQEETCQTPKISRKEKANQTRFFAGLEGTPANRKLSSRLILPSTNCRSPSVYLLRSGVRGCNVQLGRHDFMKEVFQGLTKEQPEDRHGTAWPLMVVNAWLCSLDRTPLSTLQGSARLCGRSFSFQRMAARRLQDAAQKDAGCEVRSHRKLP